MGGANTKRIVLLGKTGAGKSSLGNTIFGKNVFRIYHTAKSGTSRSRPKTRSVNGIRVTLIDTPDLFNTDKSEEELKPGIARCLTECAPGPHAFLIVLKVEKITEHEQSVINKIQECFSEEAFKYATVVFTHGDQLPDGETIENFVQQNKFVSDLVNKCGGRCHVVDNRHWNKNTEDEYRSNQFQVSKLLNTIEKMVTEHDGSCYTNELRQEVEEEIQQEEEQIGQTSEHASEDEIEEQAEGSNTKRIVLLGKTGAGKSSVANTIFGEDVFKVDHTFNSKTRECRAETRSVNGRKITLIDTPGFFDTERSEEELRPEIVRCIVECAPGPHAFLIVLKVEKFIEQAVINKIQEYFTEEAFKYATVVFTHGDQLPKGMKIENFVQQNKFLSDLVKKCGDRCYVVDNKSWNRNTEDKYRSNQFQVENLLNTIEKMVTENNGSCYTSDNLKAVDEVIQQEEEQIRQTSGNMSEEEIREKAKSRVFKKLWVRLAGIATGVLMGALFGVAVPLGVAGIGLKNIVQLQLQTIVKLVGGGAVAAVEGAVAAGGGAVAAGGGAAAAVEGAVIAVGGAAAGGGGAVAAVGGAAAAVEGAVIAVGGAAAGGGGAAAAGGGGTAAAVEGAVAAGGGAAVGGAAVVVGFATVGALAGGVKGYYAAEGAETPQEAAKKTYEAVKTGAQTVIDGAQAFMDGARGVMKDVQGVMDGAQTVMDGARGVMKDVQGVMDGAQALATDVTNDLNETEEKKPKES